MAYDFFGLMARNHHKVTLEWQTEMTHRLLAIEKKLNMIIERLDDVDARLNK
tara:strand:- start:865 stop:1020 length:156 start_codon:yes stop_codon:yes gene_type:complete